MDKNQIKALEDTAIYTTYLQHKPSWLFNQGQSDGKAYTAHA